VTIDNGQNPDNFWEIKKSPRTALMPDKEDMSRNAGYCPGKPGRVVTR